MLDVLIRNAKIVDGTGAPARDGCVGILGGKIVLTSGTEKAAETIDAHGRCVCPGFIDAHSHGDMLLGTEDARLFKTTQGVTTEVTGQCGLSMAPIRRENLLDARHLLSVGTTYFPEDMKNWDSFGRFLQYADRQAKTVNEKMYVGHSTLRLAVMGMANRAVTAKELDAMKGLLRDAMEAGAAGLSTGLIYTPGCYAPPEEIIELAKVIAPFNGIYASHMRNESASVVAAVKETIDVGRRAGVLVDISHHKILGRPNWGLQKETLRLIHKANDEGIPAFCDQYPYTCNMTTLNACIPPWHFDRGFDALTEQLTSPRFRAKVRAEMENIATPYDNYYINAGGWDGVFVSFASATPEAENKFISQYAKETGRDPWDAYFDLLCANHCIVGGIFSSMCEADVCEIIQDPFCIVGSDGVTRSWKEKGHPRACGTFPHVITHFVREKGILTLEQAVRKMTGQTAEYLRIKNKGFIRQGYDADLLIFDENRLRDTATYTHSNSLTEGIDYVYVNGRLVYHNKTFTGCCPGRVLRGHD